MIRWLLVLLAAICIVYSLLWWTAAWFVRSNVAQRIDALESNGISISVQQQDVIRWLNLGFYYEVKGVNVEIPIIEMKLEIPGKLQTGINFFNPFKVTTEASAGTVFLLPFFHAKLGALTGTANVRLDRRIEAFDVQLKNAEINMLLMIKLTGEDIAVSYQSSNGSEKVGSLQASARLTPNERHAAYQAFLDKFKKGVLLSDHDTDIELEATFYPSGPLIDINTLMDNNIHFLKKWLRKEGHYIVVGTLNAPVHEMLTQPSKALIFGSKTGDLNVILCPKQCKAHSGLECEPTAVIQNGRIRDESAIVHMSLPGEFADKNGSEICEIL